LRSKRQFEVSGPLGTTLIAVEPGRARVVSDPGPRQYCVRQGWLMRGPAKSPSAPPTGSACRSRDEPRFMTQSVIELTVTDEDRRVAWLATAAVGLSLVDAAIPSPLPGRQAGAGQYRHAGGSGRYGWATAVWVSGLRILAGSLLLGFFLAPGFFLSLTGSTLSLLTLGLARHLPARWFGPVSLSILAAFAHIGGQLLLARVWLIPHDGVFLLTPIFAAAALVFRHHQRPDRS
jgi:heptaprenyl diphosphate synthase